MKLRNFFNVAVVSALVISSSAFAEGADSKGSSMDFSALSSSISFSSVIAVLMGIAAGAIGISLAIAGIKHIKSLVRSS
ncbi:hypothetical protein KKJ06_08155 [Xenorhabdus bovienii]|uniref:hypothetical protein n=1 Tax=Xenorhabdus bovienii TaxID=40576 RepID=UPI0023B302C5|nr:hypothetical protein [Xenorhabdus bovienii]MDE9555410.1 hypothetical protein [Xenorhabdus bovienii]